jgi:cell division initiation protein
MTISPLEIQQQQFTTRFRGFDVREVDAFLDQMANAFESLQRKTRDQAMQIERLREEIEGYKKREEAFKRAVVGSQEAIDQMKENARKAGELVIANAEVKAEGILNRAHGRLAQLHEDIAELKRQRMQIEVQVRGIVEAHMKLLDLGQEEMRKIDEEDSKLRILPPVQS